MPFSLVTRHQFPFFHQLCVVLRMRNRSRLCYHFLFFMMTQTPLSAARSTRRGEKLPTRPGVSAATRSSSFQPQASSLQNLIANLELESRPTRRKISPLRISNRKYLAIFHFISRPLRRAASLSFPPSFPEGRGFIPSVKNPGRSPSPLAQLHPRKPFFTNHYSRVTSHEFLIYCSAIRNPCKALKT